MMGQGRAGSGRRGQDTRSGTEECTEGDDVRLLCTQSPQRRRSTPVSPGPCARQEHLPVWMSLCRSRFPMLLKIRPQISQGWMYLQPDRSLRAAPHGGTLQRAHLS